MVTKPAMTVMNAGIRTRSGMTFRKREMTIFDPSRTKVAAIPIPTPFSAEVVTASVGQSPSTTRKMGFSLQSPFMNSAEAAGADGLLVVTPYYNRPTQEGLYRHFSAIADSVNVPVILYNVPGRTVCDMLPETVVRLAEHPRIVGIKEATGDLSRAESILGAARPGFLLLSGDDPTAAELMKRGACGVISVTANVAPRAVHDMCVTALAGRHAEATALNEKLMPLHLAMFVEPNPIPVKWAVARMGLMDRGIRLPLTPLSERLEPELLAAMKAAGVTFA